MRLLPTTKRKRFTLLAINALILLVAPYEWLFVCKTLGLPRAGIEQFCTELGSALLDLAWVGGFIVGGATLAAIAVGREGLSQRYRRRVRVMLVGVSTLFAINCIASVEFGNGDDLSLHFHSGGAILSIGTPPDQPTWIRPYGRVFFDPPPNGVAVRLAPAFCRELYCHSRSFVYVQSTYVSTWPLWAGTIGLAAGALWRKRLFLAGECQSCGYNLTGNVSGRCPECGTMLQAIVQGELNFRQPERIGTASHSTSPSPHA